MKKLLRVDYHSNPNMPDDCNHIGHGSKLTGQSYKEFTNEADAIRFWGACSWPITKLQEVYAHELAKYVNRICIEEAESEPDEIEEFIHSQRDMYELVDSSINFEELD